MPAPRFLNPLSLALLAMPLSAHADAGPELPGGGADFRERMLAWSPAEQAPAPVVVEERHGHRAEQGQAAGTMPRLSSRFGYRSDPLQGDGRMHSGIDIPGPQGTPIQASAAGVVRFAGSAGGYGQMVEIDHGGGLTTRYAHLSRILVRPFAPVARGETIALMGSTGRSTGSHLHFEVRTNGRAANPLGYFGGDSGHYVSRSVRLAPLEPHVSQYARARAAAGASSQGGF